MIGLPVLLLMSGLLGCSGSGGSVSSSVSKAKLEAIPSLASFVITPTGREGLDTDVATATVTLSGPAPAGIGNFFVVVTAVPPPDEPFGTPQVVGWTPSTITFAEGTTSTTFPITPDTRRQAQIQLNILDQRTGAAAPPGGTHNQFATFSFGMERIETGNAGYDGGFKARRCINVDSFCESSGIFGRGLLTDPFANGSFYFANGTPEDGLVLGIPDSEFGTTTPNTIQGTCQDDSGMGDHSVDRVKVMTTDGSVLSAGKDVVVEADVWGAGRLDFFYAPDATNPAWTLVSSFDVAGSGRHIVSAPLTLSPGPTQAVRASFVISSSPVGPCPLTAMRDADDLVFATYQSGPVPNTSPAVFFQTATTQAIALPGSLNLAATIVDDGLPVVPGRVTTTWRGAGSGVVAFANSGAAITTATVSKPGKYAFSLEANDGVLKTIGHVIVNVVQVNGPPTVFAGADKSIALPTTAVALADSSVSDDGLPIPPSATTFTWSQVSGPSAAAFFDVNALHTSVTFPSVGSYVLRLTATDGALSASDELVVVVRPMNQAPIVNAGPDQVTSSPAAVLAGTVSDDGEPLGLLTTQWTLLSGPGDVAFQNALNPSTTATFSLPGAYVLRLSATDSALAVTDDVTITVLSPNTPPVVSAGVDQVGLTSTPINLNGSASDDGLPVSPGLLSVSWSVVSGPGIVAFGSATSATTTASFATAGTYVLRLTASDGAATTSDDVNVLVRVPNIAPVVNAGPDRVVTLPAVATLSGSFSDDGLPVPVSSVVVSWSKVSGPGTVTFANAAAAQTTASFSVAGSYVLRLTANDSALVGKDDLTVTANPAPPSVKVRYRIAAPATPNDAFLRPRLNVVNTGMAAVALSDLKIRYWYTVDTQKAQIVSCVSAPMGCNRVTQLPVTVSPAKTGADRYMEVGFTAANGTLAGGGQTGEIQWEIHKSDLSKFIESNDYSYSTGATQAAPTTLVDWNRVAVYWKGARIWGVEP